MVNLPNASWPDITFVENMLDRKQINPTVEEWKILKRVLDYLKGTKDFSLIYGEKGENLECFVDSILPQI